MVLALLGEVRHGMFTPMQTRKGRAVLGTSLSIHRRTWVFHLGIESRATRAPVRRVPHRARARGWTRREQNIAPSHVRRTDADQCHAVFSSGILKIMRERTLAWARKRQEVNDAGRICCAPYEGRRSRWPRLLSLSHEQMTDRSPVEVRAGGDDRSRQSLLLPTAMIMEPRSLRPPMPAKDYRPARICSSSAARVSRPLL